MGSKSSMLSNGLSTLVLKEARRAERTVDLFTGSAAIASHVATQVERPVLAVDLQAYATALADSTLARTEESDLGELQRVWIDEAKAKVTASSAWSEWPGMNGRLLKKDVIAAREQCAGTAGGAIWRAYGGYYYSPHQALGFDQLRASLPAGSERALCLAALIRAAARCAAAPGHTAQPFRPTKTGKPFIRDAWKRDVFEVTSQLVAQMNPVVARTKGETRVANALEVAGELGRKDLAILDPPYSAAQYSRFYHALETLVHHEPFSPQGAGRYPPQSDRPKSLFSLKGNATEAMADLLEALASAGCRAIVTFPVTACSNGLSGRKIVKLAAGSFEVEEKVVSGRFSTLGGNNALRPARHPSKELILLLKPRRRAAKTKPRSAVNR